MRREIMIALRATVVTLVLTGLIYPLAMTGVAQALFRDKANGSLVRDGKGTVVGSELIGQAFANPAYVQGRLSAAGNGYDATASSGSNLGPTSKKLRDRVAADVERLRKENPDAPLPIPAELVTTSASGLDPELSPQAALLAGAAHRPRPPGRARAHRAGDREPDSGPRPGRVRRAARERARGQPRARSAVRQAGARLPPATPPTAAAK